LAVYTIKDLEKLSGIKAHTLRIWEKRYGIINPKRTDTNIRYYMDEDLKRLLNIALLNRYGYKISKIACMSDSDINKEVLLVSEKMNEHDSQLDALTISMIEMDEIKFNKIINQNLEQFGFEKTMMEVIYPFLDKLSLLWLTGSINTFQENFMANLIRQKIYVALDNAPLFERKDNKTILLYLPEGESQELSILFLHYLLKTRGYYVINIGQNITVDDLRVVKDSCKPDIVFTMINEPRPKLNIRDYLERVHMFFEPARLLVSGYQLFHQDILSGSNYTVIKSLEEVLQLLESDNEKEIPGESR
jgi:MerR family transcriptional regulator, light-induced transcriptional regulator